eukprot:TRINITY_DN13527_c0_g1_i1.p1 TRINITY_DN13527_c0_g1~~TRINITY_DN13527_c0_g1_i1.p1  ORF type:complete len:1117 (+),score=160.91 TRINITY_DN13527_c0_g1_i1:171-3521(+)
MSLRVLNKQRTELQKRATRQLSALTNEGDVEKRSLDYADVDLEIRKKVERVGELYEELDTLFAEMGKTVTVMRTGVQQEIRIAAGTQRTVEIKLPPASEEAAWLLSIQGNLDPAKHVTTNSGDERDPKQGQLPAELFELTVADTARQAADGPPRIQSAAGTIHGVQLTTDFPSCFVNLYAQKTCHILLRCRAQASSHSGQLPGQALATSRDRTTSIESDDSGGGTARNKGFASKVGQNLRQKIKKTRQITPRDRGDREKTRQTTPRDRGDREATKKSKDRAAVHAAKAMPSTPSSSSPSLHLERRPSRTFAERVFPDGLPVTDAPSAQRKVLELWLHPISRFTTPGLKRPQGSWLQKLSWDCPRKLIRWLQKANQDRRALMIIAVGGAFAFVLKRQRQLHLMRARTALRQLLWYKTLFAASRFQFLVVYASEGREAAREAAKQLRESTRASPGASSKSPVKSRSLSFARRKTQTHGEHGMTTEEETSVDLVRRHNRNWGGRRAGAAGFTKSPSDEAQEPLRAIDEGEESFKRRNNELRIAKHLQELFLARQGFHINPRPNRRIRGKLIVPSNDGTTTAETGPSIVERNQAMMQEFSERLGREVQQGSQPRLDLPAPEEQNEESIVAREVGASTLVMTISPNELPLLFADSNASVQFMGAEDFQSFYKDAVAKTTSELIKRRAQEAEQVPVQQDKAKVVRITKRYLLRFFDEDLPDLPWLHLLQSLLLVIRGKASFHSVTERYLYETKVKSYNEERKAALKRPGMFAPLEACLWSHPVILGESGKLQRALVIGDSATAWKSVVFEGRCHESSERDILGRTFYSQAAEGGIGSRMLRKAVELGGPFSAYGYIEPRIAPPAEHGDFLATRTASGFPVRPFGFKGPAAQAVFRMEDQVQNISQSTEPKDVRLEKIRRHRHALAMSTLSCQGERTAAMIADGESRAQTRYSKWVMSSDVPDDARDFKQSLLPYFDSFMSSAGAGDTSKVSADGVGEREDLPEGWSAGQLTYGTAPDDESAQATPENKKQQRKKQPNASSTGPPSSRLLPAAAPQTAEEVGRWLAQNDALQTIKSDKTTREQCAVGWKSGFRKQPMTDEEIIRIRAAAARAVASKLPTVLPV